MMTRWTKTSGYTTVTVKTKRGENKAKCATLTWQHQKLVGGTSGRSSKDLFGHRGLPSSLSCKGHVVGGGVDGHRGHSRGHSGEVVEAYSGICSRGRHKGHSCTGHRRTDHALLAWVCGVWRKNTTVWRILDPCCELDMTVSGCESLPLCVYHSSCLLCQSTAPHCPHHNSQAMKISTLKSVTYTCACVHKFYPNLLPFLSVLTSKYNTDVFLFHFWKRKSSKTHNHRAPHLLSCHKNADRLTQPCHIHYCRMNF